MAPTPLPTEHEEPWPEFDIQHCPDEVDDKPRCPPLEPLSDGFPPLFLGCAPFSQIYVSEATMRSDMPLRVTRLALRYGIKAFDTSPSYHPSELILGRALSALRSEFPRESYKIITKCGKYGPSIKDHILDENMVKKSIERSLKRFETDYLDVVYIHDVEFTSSLPIPAGNHTLAFTNLQIAKEYGLAEEDKGKIWGDGDLKLLNALRTLKLLKEEGKIRMFGISGLPLPTLLRLTKLASHHGTPIDIIQTYSHQNLQNTSLSTYLPHFHSAGVSHIANASPLNMGMLTMNGMASWHPALEVNELVETTENVKEYVKGRGFKLEDVAVRFGMRDLIGRGGEKMRAPVVVGCSNLEQVHSAVHHYVQATLPTPTEEDERMRVVELGVENMYVASGMKDYSWKSGL